MEEHPLFKQIVDDHRAVHGNTGFIVLVYARGDWCPFCRTWAQEWLQKKELIENKGGSIVYLSSQYPVLIPETWKPTSQGFPLTFDIKFHLDDHATLASKLGVVVEKPLNKGDQYPDGKMAQPAAFIFRVKDDGGVEQLVSWVHAPRIANLKGALGRADVDALLNEAFKRLEENGNKAPSTFHARTHMNLSAPFRLLVSKVWAH